MIPVVYKRLRVVDGSFFYGDINAESLEETMSRFSSSSQEGNAWKSRKGEVVDFFTWTFCLLSCYHDDDVYNPSLITRGSCWQREWAFNLHKIHICRQSCLSMFPHLLLFNFLGNEVTDYTHPLFHPVFQACFSKAGSSSMLVVWSPVCWSQALSKIHNENHTTRFFRTKSCLTRVSTLISHTTSLIKHATKTTSTQSCECPQFYVLLKSLIHRSWSGHEETGRTLCVFYVTPKEKNNHMSP